MALQELDVHIHYRPGKANNNADALSRCTTTHISDSDVPWKVLATLQADVLPVKEGEEETLSAKQLADPEIAEVITYLEENALPSNEQRARELTLTRTQYEVIDDVLYHIEPDKTLRIVVPKVERKVVFDEVYSGVLGIVLVIGSCFYIEFVAKANNCKELLENNPEVLHIHTYIHIYIHTYTKLQHVHTLATTTEHL